MVIRKRHSHPDIAHNLLTGRDLGWTAVEIGEDHYMSGGDDFIEHQYGILQLTLPGGHPGGTVYYQGENGLTGGKVGKLVYLPKGVGFFCDWNGGVLRTLRCYFHEKEPSPGVWTSSDFDGLLSIDSPLLLDLMLHLRNEVGRPSRYSDVLLEGLCLQMTGALGRHLDDGHRAAEGYSRLPGMGDVLDRLDGRRGMPTLQGLAREFGCSERHFGRMFQQASGRTFSDYTSEKQFALAKYLLVNSTMRIKEIAFELGFDSATAFSRAFRREAGSDPRTFRATIRRLQ